MKSKAFIRVGILFLATIVIVFWGLNYLKGKNLFSGERSYYAVYDRIGGLTKSSPVTVNGFQVGQVRNIDLSIKNPSLIEVKFSISYRAIRIPKGSTARIYSTDLMGTKGIALDLATDTTAAAPGDTLKNAIEGDLRDQVNAQMLPLKVKAESLMSSMDSVLIGIQLVFNERNRDNLARSVYSVSQTLNNLESASQFLNEYVKNESLKVSAVLSNADTLARSILRQTDELQAIIGNVRQFSDTLAHVPLTETFRSLQTVLVNVHDLTQKVAAGEGSLGKLMVDDSLYNALLVTNSSLNRLIEDIRIHPGKYIRVSLTDKSKDIYSVGDSELAGILSGEGTSDYYVVILQSPTPVSPDDPSLKGTGSPAFIQVGSLYYYYIYQNQRIETCLRKLDKVRKNNPSAGIFTWVNGKWKRLSI